MEVSALKTITYWDRTRKVSQTERVYGDRSVRFLYETPIGRLLRDALLTKPWVSRVVGWYQSSPLSKRRIGRFIEDFSIEIDEYETKDYSSFNDFFVRKFRPGVRKFTLEAGEIPAFAEGRYLAFEKIEADVEFPVKGKYLAPEAVLGSPAHVEAFSGGPLLIARLCPTDYHRFHFPDGGKFLDQYTLAGRLESVNPLALANDPRIFQINERKVSILQTEHFGRLAYVEVGALCVGRIVHTHPIEIPFKRGDEKGYFLFGGSTVLLFGQRGMWTPDSDLLSKTRERIETFVRLGERVATLRS